MVKIIAVANQKGGVGKTTTVYHLGYLLQKKGGKVLLVGFGPQASLTAWFQEKDPLEIKETIVERLDRHLKLVKEETRIIF